MNSDGSTNAGTTDQEPSVGVSAQQLKDQISTLTRLLYLGKNDVIEAPEDTSEFLEAMHIDNEDTLALFTRLLTTGTDYARELTGTVIRSMLSRIAQAEESRSGPDVVISAEDRESWYPYSHVQVLRVWNTVNVLEEVGEPSDDGEVLSQITLFENYYDAMDPASNNYPSDDAYWRGLAAVGTAVVDPMRNLDLYGYIAWAGAYPDIKRAIDTAHERNTFDLNTLLAVIDDQDQSASSLREGTL